MLFGIRFCKVLCGLIWLLYGLNHIWFDDSYFKFICPQNFESGLLQFVITKLKIRPREPTEGERSSYRKGSVGIWTCLEGSHMR